MKRFALAALVACSSFAPAFGADRQLDLVRTIPMPGIEGRIDHLAIDSARQRLFVAALGSDAVVVVDLEKALVALRISGIGEPQGVAYSPANGVVVVSSGQDGSCHLYDAQGLTDLATVRFGGDADNLRIEQNGDRVQVGFGSGALGSLELRTLSRSDGVALPGHPEAFALEEKGTRVFVNVPSASRVVVVDRAKQAVVASWELPPRCGNFPMSLDEEHHRVFVGCRNPARIFVLDTVTGKTVGSVESVGDADDLFWSAKDGLLFATGGEGFLDVLSEDGGRWRRVQRVTTGKGARTSLLVADTSRVYVAVPNGGGHPAEIREYRFGP